MIVTRTIPACYYHAQSFFEVIEVINECFKIKNKEIISNNLQYTQYNVRNIINFYMNSIQVSVNMALFDLAPSLFIPATFSTTSNMSSNNTYFSFTQTRQLVHTKFCEQHTTHHIMQP